MTSFYLFLFRAFIVYVLFIWAMYFFYLFLFRASIVYVLFIWAMSLVFFNISSITCINKGQVRTLLLLIEPI